MLSGLLNSNIAIEVNIRIMIIFASIRFHIQSSKLINSELEAIKANPDNTPALKSVSKPAAVNIISNPTQLEFRGTMLLIPQPSEGDETNARPYALATMWHMDSLIE